MQLAFERGDAAAVGPQIERLIKRGESVTLQVSGGSMTPFLRDRRDAAILTPLRDWPPKVGDVLFYRGVGGKYTLHRVYRVKQGGILVMNGDAQTWTEEPVMRDQVIARAAGFVVAGELIDADDAAYQKRVRRWRPTRPFRWVIFACYRLYKRLRGGKQ